MTPEETAEPRLRVVSRNATTAEIAAVTAVLTAALEELANGQSAEGPRVSAWQRSQRDLRKPITPGPGAWRSF